MLFPILYFGAYCVADIIDGFKNPLPDNNAEREYAKQKGQVVYRHTTTKGYYYCSVKTGKEVSYEYNGDVIELIPKTKDGIVERYYASGYPDPTGYEKRIRPIPRYSFIDVPYNFYPSGKYVWDEVNFLKFILLTEEGKKTSAYSKVYERIDDLISVGNEDWMRERYGNDFVDSILNLYPALMKRKIERDERIRKILENREKWESKRNHYLTNSIKENQEPQPLISKGHKRKGNKKKCSDGQGVYGQKRKRNKNGDNKYARKN